MDAKARRTARVGHRIPRHRRSARRTDSRMTTETPSPALLWKGMSEEQRLRAADAFWREPDSADQQIEAMVLLAQKLKARPKYIATLPVEKKAKHLAHYVGMPDVAGGAPAGQLSPRPSAADDGRLPRRARHRPRQRPHQRRAQRRGCRRQAQAPAPTRWPPRIRPTTCGSTSRRSCSRTPTRGEGSRRCATVGLRCARSLGEGGRLGFARDCLASACVHRHRRGAGLHGRRGHGRRRHAPGLPVAGRRDAGGCRRWRAGAAGAREGAHAAVQRRAPGRHRRLPDVRVRAGVHPPPRRPAAGGRRRAGRRRRGVACRAPTASAARTPRRPTISSPGSRRTGTSSPSTWSPSSCRR